MFAALGDVDVGLGAAAQMPTAAPSKGTSTVFLSSAVAGGVVWPAWRRRSYRRESGCGRSHGRGRRGVWQEDRSKVGVGDAGPVEGSFSVSPPETFLKATCSSLRWRSSRLGAGVSPAPLLMSPEEARRARR